jgi:hypothetical protein
MSSIFISHSSRDKDVTDAFAAWLTRLGYDDVFVDHKKDDAADFGHQDDRLNPSQNWKDALSQSLGRSDAVVFLLSANWFASKWCQGEFIAATLAHKKILPVLISAGDQSERDQLAGACAKTFGDIQYVDASQDLQAGMDRLERIIDRSRVTPFSFSFDPAKPPYKGLEALEENDAGIFFGRELETVEAFRLLKSMREELLTGEARVREAPARMLVILGSSGAGKSSLLRAGLLPQLRLRPRDWLVTDPFIPKEDPLLELGRSLASTFVRLGRRCSAGEMRSMLANDPANGLAKVAADLRTLANAPNATLILAIDQAEELVRTDAERVSALMQQLRNAFATPDWLGALTVRTDTFEDIQNRRLLEDVPIESYSLSPMPIARMAEIIEGPGRRARLRVDPSMVNAMVADANTGDALPLLAFTLERLWRDHGQDGDLTLAEYQALGDVAHNASPLESAVARAAEKVMSSSSKPEQAALLRAFVPGLVDLTDDMRPVRRRAAWENLESEALRPMERLIETRLMVTRVADERKTVEVAHEALLRAWPSLIDAIEAAKPDLRALQDVERSAADWEDAKKRAEVQAPSPPPVTNKVLAIALRTARGAGSAVTQFLRRLQEYGLEHRGRGLARALRLVRQPEWALRLGARGKAYLIACAKAQNRRRFAWAGASALVAISILTLSARTFIGEQRSELREALSSTNQTYAALIALPPSGSLLSYVNPSAEGYFASVSDGTAVNNPMGVWCRDEEDRPFASVSDQHIRIWDQRTFRLKRILRRADSVSAPAVCDHLESGRFVVSGHGGLELWQLEPLRRLAILRLQPTHGQNSPCSEDSTNRTTELSEGERLLGWTEALMRTALAAASWRTCFEGYSAPLSDTGLIATVYSSYAGSEQTGALHFWSAQDGRYVGTARGMFLDVGGGNIAASLGETDAAEQLEPAHYAIAGSGPGASLLNIRTRTMRPIRASAAIINTTIIDAESDDPTIVVATFNGVEFQDVNGAAKQTISTADLLRPADEWSPLPVDPWTGIQVSAEPPPAAPVDEPAPEYEETPAPDLGAQKVEYLFLRPVAEAHAIAVVAGWRTTLFSNRGQRIGESALCNDAALLHCSFRAHDGEILIQSGSAAELVAASGASRRIDVPTTSVLAGQDDLSAHASGRRIVVFDANNLTLVRMEDASLPYDFAQSDVWPVPADSVSLAFTTNGQQLVATWPGGVVSWQVSTGRVLLDTRAAPRLTPAQCTAIRAPAYAAENAARENAARTQTQAEAFGQRIRDALGEDENLEYPAEAPADPSAESLDGYEPQRARLGLAPTDHDFDDLLYHDWLSPANGAALRQLRDAVSSGFSGSNRPRDASAAHIQALSVELENEASSIDAPTSAASAAIFQNFIARARAEWDASEVDCGEASTVTLNLAAGLAFLSYPNSFVTRVWDMRTGASVANAPGTFFSSENTAPGAILAYGSRLAVVVTRGHPQPRLIALDADPSGSALYYFPGTEITTPYYNSGGPSIVWAEDRVLVATPYSLNGVNLVNGENVQLASMADGGAWFVSSAGRYVVTAHGREFSMTRSTGQQLVSWRGRQDSRAPDPIPYNSDVVIDEDSGIAIVQAAAPIYRRQLQQGQNTDHEYLRPYTLYDLNADGRRLGDILPSGIPVSPATREIDLGFSRTAHARPQGAFVIADGERLLRLRGAELRTAMCAQLPPDVITVASSSEERADMQLLRYEAYAEGYVFAPNGRVIPDNACNDVGMLTTRYWTSLPTVLRLERRYRTLIRAQEAAPDRAGAS